MEIGGAEVCLQTSKQTNTQTKTQTNKQTNEETNRTIANEFSASQLKFQKDARTSIAQHTNF